MSDYIVLIKQVPDVARITDNAFDPESGNLIRARLASVVNELDAQALGFAWRMRELSGETDSRIICLSMGPPMASEVLYYSLAREADGGVLLTDRALGGADTPATANPLAYAIKKISSEMFKDPLDYFVVCGMQSVDGDTAQVPPQIAEELGISCLPYATDVEYQSGRFRFRHLISGGSQVVHCRKLPVVITVASYDWPRYPSFAATRRARAQGITKWSADDVKPTAMGNAGSKTRVVRVFPPPRTKRLAKKLDDVTALVKQLDLAMARQEQGAKSEEKPGYILPARRSSWFERNFEGTEKEIEDFKRLRGLLEKHGINEKAQLDEAAVERIKADPEQPFSEKNINWMLSGLAFDTTAYEGEVWVMAEHQDGRLNDASFELLGKARALADALEVKTGVVLLGMGVRGLADELIAAGADRVYLCEDPLLAEFDPLAWRKVAADIFSRHKPQIFLFGATPQGRVLAPLLSYRVGCGLTADCTELEIRDTTRQSQIAVLVQTRPALGGNVMASICSRNSSCQMASARPGVMQRIKPDSSRTGEIIEEESGISAEDIGLEIIEKLPACSKVDFKTEVIIGGGKGLGGKESFNGLIDELAAAIAERYQVRVSKGATRSAIEQGYCQRELQLGQTGTAVSPRLYLAIGISGAIQHMIGVAGSGTIVAINPDPEAPVCSLSDYFLTDRAERLIPELISKLKERA